MDRFNGTVLWERGTNASGGLVLLSLPGTGTGQQQASTMHAAVASQQAATAAMAAGAAAAAASG
jgi:hypothetical protein